MRNNADQLKLVEIALIWKYHFTAQIEKAAHRRIGLEVQQNKGDHRKPAVCYCTY